MTERCDKGKLSTNSISSRQQLRTFFAPRTLRQVSLTEKNDKIYTDWRGGIKHKQKCWCGRNKTKNKTPVGLATRLLYMQRRSNKDEMALCLSADNRPVSQVRNLWLSTSLDTMRGVSFLKSPSDLKERKKKPSWKIHYLIKGLRVTSRCCTHPATQCKETLI